MFRYRGHERASALLGACSRERGCRLPRINRASNGNEMAAPSSAADAEYPAVGSGYPYAPVGRGHRHSLGADLD